MVIKVFSDKFLQAWSACMLCMVQGDLTVLTVDHALTASKTGFFAGLAYCITLFLDGNSVSVWKAAWLTGVLTMVADIIVHPTHFGDQWLEAFCTGLGAAGICFAWEKLRGQNGSNNT